MALFEFPCLRGPLLGLYIAKFPPFYLYCCTDRRCSHALGHGRFSAIFLSSKFLRFRGLTVTHQQQAPGVISVNVSTRLLHLNVTSALARLEYTCYTLTFFFFTSATLFRTGSHDIGFRVLSPHVRLGERPWTFGRYLTAIHLTKISKGISVWAVWRSGV